MNVKNVVNLIGLSAIAFFVVCHLLFHSDEVSPVQDALVSAREQASLGALRRTQRMAPGTAQQIAMHRLCRNNCTTHSHCPHETYCCKASHTCDPCYECCRDMNGINGDCGLCLCPRGSFKSQFGQDRWILMNMFASPDVITPEGTFIEFGAVDGVQHSNTFYFENSLHWKGALVEPSIRYAKHIPQNRPRSVAVHGAICGKAGHQKFLDIPGRAHRLSGLVGSMDRERLQNVFKANISLNVSAVQCFLLKDIFDKVRRKRVNYMSMDLEGGELPVLESFPFQDYDVDVLQVESHMQGCMHQTCNKARALMPAPLGSLVSLGSLACDAKWVCASSNTAPGIAKVLWGHGFSLVRQYLVPGMGPRLMKQPCHPSEFTVDLIFQRAPRMSNLVPEYGRQKL